jgi:hypothetical protein
VTEQTRHHPRAPKVYVFDQQVCREEHIAPGVLTNHRRVIANAFKK